MLYYKCSLYVKLRSRIIPRSLMEETGTIVLFKKFKDISSDSKFSNCRVPTNRNLVFSGLINNEFLQHHSATRLYACDTHESHTWITRVSLDISHGIIWLFRDFFKVLIYIRCLPAACEVRTEKIFSRGLRIGRGRRPRDCTSNDI